MLERTQPYGIAAQVASFWPCAAMRKPGRNDPCPCGSGKKYKRCCLPQDEASNSNVFQRILDTNPRNPEGLNALGMAALQSGRLDSAIALIARAVEGNPGEPFYHSNLGLAYRAAGRILEAEASFRRACAIDPRYAPASSNLGILLSEQGRHDEALAQFQNAVDADPRSAEARDNLGSALLHRGDCAAALESFRQAYRLKPRFALAYSNAGNALGGLGKQTDAIDHFEKAIALDPDNPLFHFNCAKSLSDFGKVEEAADRFRSALDLKPDFAEAHNGLGLMRLEMGRKDDAILSLLTAVRLKPDLAEAYFNLHSLLLDSRDTAVSAAYLRKVIELRPEDKRARLHLSILLEHTGDLDGAASELGHAGVLSPELYAIVEGWWHVRSQSGVPPNLIGVPYDAFRIGLQAAQVNGLVLEFGVRFGVSIRQIAELADQHVHGFDSFEGLPESWGTEPQGSYSTLGALPRVPGNVSLHRGWFEQSLPEFLRSHAGPVRFANIDCDIYSSTRTVLTLLAERIVRGTVIVFDEYIGHASWRSDEFRALQEAVSEHGWRYEYICVGPSTGQVVVRL